MAGIRRFDDEAFKAVFNAECRGVVRAAYFVVGDWDLAQEIAQDSFAELFVRWTKVSEYDNPGAWLRRIAVRRAVRVRSRRQVSEFVEEHGTDPSGPANQAMDLRSALLELPVRQRAAVVLHYLEDLPVDEIADALGCSPSTVKVHLHRARETLRVTLPENSLSGDLP